MSGKIWTPERRLAFNNKKLALENSKLQAKTDLLEKTIHNSLSGLAQNLTGGGLFGGGMSNLTSLNPMTQNNIYAPVTLLWTQLMYMYKSHGLIQTMIDMPVLDALRGGLEFSSDGQLSPDDIATLEDWMEENAILERIGDAFIWARLFGGGALIINSEGDHEQPLGDEIIDGQIEFYDACRWELSCERRIPASGLYGFYGKQLHKSRVLTITGKRAPYLIRAQLSDWGMSEIERMLEDFNLFLRNRNVIYELLEEAKVDVYKLKGLRDALISANGTAITTKRIQTMNQVKSYNNALLFDSEDDYQMKQVSFGGLAEMMKENRMGIASALRMPMSKIFGIPSTGLNSGQDDIENYNGLIESEVRQPMKQIIRKVLKIVIKHLFKDETLDIDFTFKPLRTMSSTEEEAIKTSRFNRIAAMYDKQLMTSREVGEAVQKDDLISVPLAAEKGLLDDHPAAAAPEQIPLSEETSTPTASEEEQKIGEAAGEVSKPLTPPKAGAKQPSLKPKAPESPKANTIPKRTT